MAFERFRGDLLVISNLSWYCYKNHRLAQKYTIAWIVPKIWHVVLNCQKDGCMCRIVRCGMLHRTSRRFVVCTPLHLFDFLSACINNNVFWQGRKQPNGRTVQGIREQDTWYISHSGLIQICRAMAVQHSYSNDACLIFRFCQFSVCTAKLMYIFVPN
jgi:hypothetical protein